ncbi:uncharacterized protein C6orf141 homolog [Dasypus novemcinctus]|uniref:uncharacterized protein C6orf141 homolog n=1 Tax=Dasypus novemcinctus TaxID=9361 RepID=UPI000328E966|nr:uncharacterized protein C6orf141 homolog [Dasypus novemcinctus]XP_004471244.1 uncharacterized protein C6orf141 homolog [Dasypus novemcinctus]XP_023448258.1 uncharacterized protein C6orf141 homolog [Dasypus novemcinctus]
MKDPSARMQSPGSCGAAGSHSWSGRAWAFQPELGRRASLPPGAPNAVTAGASGSPGSTPANGSAARGPGPRAAEKQECEPWVREKVLFLLHPERWLGTQRGPAQEAVASGEDLPQAGGDGSERDGPSLSPRETRAFGSRVDALCPPSARDPAAPPKSVLVRVVDYRVTQEVQETAWTKGLMTTKTEERSITAVTFRTIQE